MSEDIKNEKDAPDTEAVKKSKKKETQTSEKKDDSKQLKKEVESLKGKIKKIQAESEENRDSFLRVSAEYDNFRKRSIKEKDNIYSDAKADCIEELLPILDNLQRASNYTDSDKVMEGVGMILKNLPDVLDKLGIESFGDPGDKFDPNMHNAIMHVDDENYGDEEIVEVLQRGYKMGDRIVRYAMVKVAN